VQTFNCYRRKVAQQTAADHASRGGRPARWAGEAPDPGTHTVAGSVTAYFLGPARGGRGLAKLKREGVTGGAGRSRGACLRRPPECASPVPLLSW
jgi:hypothetical protein